MHQLLIFGLQKQSEVLEDADDAMPDFVDLRGFGRQHMLTLALHQGRAAFFQLLEKRRAFDERTVFRFLQLFRRAIGLVVEHLNEGPKEVMKVLRD